MSDSTISDQQSKPSPVGAILAIATASLITLVYIRAPSLTARWPVVAHILFRGAVLTIGVMGAAMFIHWATLQVRFPAWARVSRHWMSIPLEGWIYLGIMFVLFTGAMLTKQNTLLLVFAFMAGPFIINGWMTYGMLSASRIERRVPARAMQGEQFSIEINLKNGHPILALWMMAVRDLIEHARENLEASILFSRVSPHSSQTGIYDVRLVNRGRYRFGPVKISSRFPLGLVERSRDFEVFDEILIYPTLRRIAPQWRQRSSNATELVSRIQPHRGIFNDEFLRLREFRPGDNPRAIHWRSTARRGELILREFHQNREHTLAVVLDLFIPLSPAPRERDTVELALSFVASLLVARGRESRDGILSLAASGNQSFEWEGHGHAGSLEPLFDGLASIEPGSAQDTTILLSETIAHSSPATQILVVTTRGSDHPYRELLTSRVDFLNINLVDPQSLMVFETDYVPERSRTEMAIDANN